jgi:hypothetical protein
LSICEIPRAAVTQQSAVGFDGLKRAIVVGTSLGRLNGSVETVTLNRTHVSVNIPEEQIRSTKFEQLAAAEPELVSTGVSKLSPQYGHSTK